MVPLNFSGGPTSATSGANGGSFDAQGKFSFGGINTGSATQSYVAMGLIALVAIGALVLALRK